MPSQSRQCFPTFYYCGAAEQSFRFDNACKRILDASVIANLGKFCWRYDVDQPVLMVVASFILHLQMAPRAMLAELFTDVSESHWRALTIAGDSLALDSLPL